MKVNNILVVVITYLNSEFHDFNPIDCGYPILIVDNSSIMIDHDYGESIKLIKNGCNIGIARALNIGCQYAIEHGYDWVVTMDQDSVITPEIIGSLYEFTQNSKDEISIVSPRHILQSGISSVSDSVSLGTTTDGIFTMTSGNLLNLSIWQKIGGFNDDLFIDFVDIDYYCKSISYGARVVTLNNVKMQHELGNLKIKKFIVDWKVFNHSSIRKYYQIRNALFMLRNYPSSILPRKYIIKFIINLLFTTVFFETEKIYKIKMMANGVKDFFRGKMGKFKVNENK